MSVLQEEYKLAIDNKMLSPKVSEQDFENMLKDETKRKEYWDYCHQKNPSFYADDYNRFSQLTTEMLGEASRPTVAENPAPTTAEEDSISLAKQNEGEQQYNIVTPMMEQTMQPTNNTAAEPIQDEEKKEEQSALDRGMQIIDDAWDKSGFLGKAFLSPMKLAEVGISLVQGAASGIVEWGGRGAMSLMAQAVENNKAGDYDTFKVDAMGNPMFVPKIGEDGQYEKAGYSIEEQIEAAKRVEKAESEGKEADIKDKNASMYVRAANKLEKVADKLHKSSMPKDVAEDATFIDLIREGEIMDAVQLSVASTGQSIPYMLLNSLPGGGLIAGTLGQANTYLDLSKEHPEMEKWKRYTYAIGSSGIEQAVEKFTNPFKGLKGASKKEVAKTLKEITDGAEKAIWKRVTGNVLKEAAGEGGEELATSVFTDIFGTMIDTDGEYGIGIIGQYNEYADQMREQNPTMTNNDILKSFVGNKAKEYTESLIMGALSGAYISTVSSIATRGYAKEEQKNDRIMLDAITATADANGLAKEDVLGIVMKEKDGELTEEENSVATLFKKNYAKATMKSVAEEQGNELVEKIANKSNGYVFEVDFADGSLGETDMAYIVDGAVYTTDADGKTIIDRTTSDKVVYVKVLKEDGSEEVKQVAVDELNLVGTPMQSSEFALQYQQGIYNTAEQLLDAQEQVVGEDNGQQPLGATEGEQGRNIEGRQFTNGQQTITASNPDSNGNVTLSAPVTLSNGVVTDQVMPQQVFDDLMNGLISEEGWQEVSSQPAAQGQAQGQQQAPQPISWSEMDANQATATVVERSKGDKVRAKKFAQKQVEVKTKALQEAQAEMDAYEGDDLDAFNAAQDKVDAAQAEVDKWTAVANGIDAYVAPIQVAPQPTPSATSASGNVAVTEEAAIEQNTSEGANKITRESVRELLSKEAQEMEKAWDNEIGNTDAAEIAHDIFWVLGANVHSMMGEEIDDYVGEHYPTQATISGETNSEKGKKEREQLKNDKNLKALDDAVKAKQAELDAIVEETRKMIKEICTSPDATPQDIAELLEALARYESRVFNLHEQSGSMNNYDMLDKYIGTTKAFQKDVKMLYGRKNAMANASAKVKEVIELADKASEVVGDKEKFAGAYKRKEDALNALTVEELEELKDVLRVTGKNDFLYQDAENRAATIREEQRRQKQANSLSDIFDNGGTQVDRPTKVKLYKYNPFDFATNDPVRPVMGTAYHEDGHVVSTDAHILVAVKQKYDKNLEGKMTDKDGKVVLESSKFPNWKLVFDGAKTNKADVTAISVDDFRSFLEGAKAKLKAEWQAKKDNGEKVGSFKDYLYNKADVMIRTNGGVHAYRLGRLMDFANALSEIGAKEVFFDGRRDASAQPMAAETNQGKAIIMPVLVDNISIEEDGRVVVGNSNTAFLYDLADKNTRMSANNSQNTLKNGNNSVPLQGEKSATQKVIDKIDSKHFPVVVFNKKNYREVMRKAGASEKLIKEVGDVLSDLKPHQVMGGFFDEGMIFIQEQTDLDAVRKAYIHERQHAFNATNEQLLLKMASTSYKSQFAAMIRAMAGNNFYDKYGMKYLVDEFICRAMEIAYSVDTDAELEAELRKIGANDKQIQIIKEINNEQRNDNSLSNARHNSLLNSNDSSGSEQVRRDSQSVSRGVLGEKGNGSAQISERRDRSGRPSETIGEVAKNIAAEQTLSNAGEQVSADGVRYNIASNDKVVAARETQLKRSVRNGLLTANEANEIREFAQAMRVIAETIAQAKKTDGSAEFPSFSEWNGLEVQVNANGTPLVSAIKSNGEYPMNIDFAKHCIKRDSTNQVLNKLAQVDPELFTSLTTDMLVEINQIINKHGLSVPCVGCFVEARRYRSAEYAKSVVETWNTLVDAVNKGDKAITAAKKKLGGKQSVDKIVEHLRNTPSDNVKISESDIISPNNYGELMMQHPSIPTLLQATQGQNNTYLVVPEAIYYGDVLNLSAENSWDVDAAYEVGGVRLQSFSDFKAKLFFDYCQVLADLASKKLPAHSYTKVPSFAELFGLTGMKINLSLYYSGTGLDADGNYTYSDESISPEFAFDLQSREGYTDNVGTMAIGVSDEHIWKLLKDDNIRSISPYHKSGINPEVAVKLKADEFVDYTNEQNAVTPKSAKKEGESWQDYYARITKRVDGKVPTIGKKVKPEFNLYDDLIDTNSPIQTAQNYVAYCQENGIVPKFPSFVYNQDGSFNEEYYKLLFDFSVYNKDGVYAPQGAVKWTEGSMPTNTVDILKQALEVEEGTIAKNQAGVDAVVNDILTNVFDRDDLAVSESQVRFSVVTDKKKIEELEASEKMKGYRTVILNEDGTFSSPMATGLGNKGKTSARTSGFELGKWEQAEERPELADENGKINLKPKKGGDTYVDYNPYIHNRLDKINTQFTSAWRKPFLVYIETEIPMSDIESGYHAEKAALSVGVHPWNGGDLVLSRYDKPVRIVPWEEVADAWAEQFEEVTFDIVNPELLPLLHERGVKILPPKKAAKEKALAAYKKWKAENSKPRFSISSIAEDAWNKYQYDGELESIRDVANYIEENMPKNEQTQALFDAIDAYNEEEFEDRQHYGMRGDLEPFEDAILEELEKLMNSTPRFSVTFASVNEELNADGISIDNDVLMEEYGLSSIELSKKDNYIKLGKIVVADKGKGNGSRFMKDLTKYADANGYTLTLTPDTSYGASSISRLKKFYKEFGFKDNKGRNTDYNVWESMLRTPKSPRFSITAEEDKAYADAVARGDMETAQRMVIEAAKKAMPNTKIVDADGNPMIVYHDTNATELVNIETGENWNDLDWRAKDEWRNREDFDEYWEERDFYTFNDKRSRRSIEMPAYFFSTKEDEYHEYGDRTIRAFLNITNPAIDPTIENAGTYDYAGEDAMNKLIEQGHDGFIRTIDNGEWDEVNAFYPNQIKSADPVTYDDNGNVIPLSERFNDDKKDIRFSLSNTNQRIFVSNAERAVESIKQEKATPQQWKAMIEKQGGLKAGEDKWLGLSEWLDSKVAPAQENETMGDAARRVAKNTITKQEILDYIAEHQIQIEEVEYTENASESSLERLEALNEEFAEFIGEANEVGEEDELDYAFKRMSEKYGDDFQFAFDVDINNRLIPIEDAMGDYAADQYIDQGRLIYNMRLGYTTEGLENKREIALTVPTIESWNENDRVHFGDAGVGRAIAWIRFGETQMKTPREVIDHVDELQFAFTNVNGRDVYAPQGSKFSKDYAVYGKLANGEMGYVLYVRDKQLSAHPTLDAALEALNAHYEANPRQVTEYSDVLVIDEIQSKRHQEGREKGYITKEGKEIKKKIKELTDKQDAIYSTNRWSGTEDMLSSNEEAAEYRRLEEEIIKLQQELGTKTGTIPDAPFDKNWHELAFKRMLRYAAENGFDYVAWTTGEQQAERYNLGKHFDSIEREDNPSINGRRFALYGANYFTFVVNEEGVITESDMSEVQGKPLADVVGKDLAIRMMSLEDGDAIDFVDLRIGGEGMKGFYDKMLPSFVAKYTKKWGAKVQDINLPSLDESAQTMHAVNVTQEMKDSVMEGQVMFSVRNTAEDLRMSGESSIFAEQYDDVPYISFDEDFDTAEVQASYDERFDDVVADIEMQGVEVDESLLYQKAGVVADYIEDINKDEKYPVVVVPSNKDVYEWMTNKGVPEELARNAQNKLNEKGGDRIRGFHQNGTIFILSQNLDSLSLAKLTYAHEIQHAKNKRNADLIIKVLNAVSRREALDFISKFGNRDVYADLLNEKEAGYYSLADEVVAYAMSEGYKLGINGNLAQYLRDKGITNEELINILNEEYERQKNDVSDSKRFFGQRDIESYRRSVTRRTQQDGGDLQSRSQEMGESTELETLSRGTQGDRGRIAREFAEKVKDSLLRIGAKRLARKYELATTPVEHTPMFSVTGAPVPTPTETKGEYLKRYMAWRESQVEQAARTKFVQDMKKADKFFEKAAKKIVDRNKPIDDFQKAVVAQGGKLNVGNNAYADTTMAIGRAGYQVRRFADHQLKNMLDAIREMMDSKLLDNIVLTWDNMDSEYTDPKNPINGKRLTVREIIGVYCQAMDVKEAKEKDLPDRGEEGFKKNLRDANGNEMSYEDVIRMVHDAVAGTTLTKKLWRAINDATKFALRYQLAAGMIDQETFDKYDRDYYVPERGWRERDLDGREEKYNESQGMTNGSPYNAALQKAGGRDSLASDPFAYIQSIAETSILSAEKNKVKQKFLQFVFDNEAIGRKTGAWNIRKVWLVEVAKDKVEVSFEKPADESKIIKGYATESQIKLASEVRQRTRAERLQHQVIVMRDGVQYIVELESEELANTLNGKYEGMNDLWEGWGNVQRSMVNYMSAINTQYNPVFPVFNFIRDFQLALISNIGEQKAVFASKFMGNIPLVQRAIWRYVAMEKLAGKEDFHIGNNKVNKKLQELEDKFKDRDKNIGHFIFKQTRIAKYLEEYFEQGAQTGFSFLRDIEALNVEIDKALTAGKFKRGAKKTKDVVLGTLSMMTEASELTVRLAQYVTARESGYSAEEAAQMAKEISVNFDRKGTESRALSKLYSFFNASIQGTNKIWRMLKHSRKANAVFWGSAALYMALGILNTLMNPDDPEEDVWASDYTRKTNFLFGKYRIPVAHFFRIFYGAGVEIVLVAQGRKTRDKAIFDTVNFTADELVPSSLFQIHNLWEFNELMNKREFNPAQYVQGAAPSWITPLTDVAMNRNFMGGKINKEPYTIKEEGKYKAGKYAMKNTDKFWIDIADLLSGGDSSAFRDYGESKGVSGSTLQHIFEGYIGQAGKFVLDAGALPFKAAKDEEITTKDIPFANRLIVPYKQESAYNQEYWTLKKDLEHYEDSLEEKKKEDRDAYWEERGSEQYKAYMRLKRLVNRKPKEGDTHTPEDVRKLMEANKEWRRLK